MKKTLFIIGLAIFSIFAFGLSQANAQPILVDLELVLAVDVSSSVSETDFNLMMQGYANALDPQVNTDIDEIIGSGSNKSIAVSLFLFSEGQYQLMNGGSNWWTLTDSDATPGFSQAARTLGFDTVVDSPNFGGDTFISSAINYATGLFATDGIVGTKQVIDVSGNGRDDNSAAARAAAISNALSQGVDTINGIVISEGDTSLLSYFETNIITGQDAFAMEASNFADFNEAIRLKIEREIPPPVPEPLSLMLLGSGLLGMLGLRRKK